MNILISKLVSIKRTRNQQKFYNQIKKQYRTRKYIINEIVNTEKKYLDDLKIIKEVLIDNFKRLFGQEEAKKVFSNLDEIIAVNQVIFDKIQFRIDKANQDYLRNYYLKSNGTKLLGHENSVLFFQNENQDILKNFECYFEYCEHYDSVCKYRNELKKSNESFKILIAEAQRDPKLQQMDIEDFLVKPVQRLPKYILLLKDLKKNTPNYKHFNQICCMKEFIHPDYDNICKYLARFEEINDKNNEKIGEFQNNQKMKEIQKQYGSNLLIIQNNIRQFVFEENVEYYITSKNRKNAHLICFNDYLLIVEIDYSAFTDVKKKIISFTEFSLGSEVNVIESQRGLLFKVTTKNKVFIFVASDAKQLNKIQSLLTDTFQKYLAQKKKDLSNSGQEQVNSWDQLQLTVSVEGTEEYNIASIQNYTVYIIKFALESIEWKVYLRYSKIRDIRNLIIQKDSSANVLKLQSSNWLRNHDNKYLDSVKINVEGFLQSIFQWNKLTKNAEAILPELGLPLNFYLLPKVVGNQNEASKYTKSSSLIENEDSVLLVAEKLQQKLKEDLQLQKLLKEHIQKDENKSREVKIFIPLPLLEYWKPTMQHGEIKTGRQEKTNGENAYLIVKVDRLMKAMELCEIVADSIQLKMFFDFRLIVVSSRGNKRCLDHDQIVLQSLPEDKNIFLEKKYQREFLSFFDETYFLEFSKYIYFPQKIEQALYKNDISRLYFLCEILFTEARNYGLTNQDYSLLYALYILMYGKDYRQLLDLQKLIPKDLIKTWQDSTWKKNTENHLSTLLPKLKNIANQNKKLKEENEDISVDQGKIYTKESLLAKIMAMNKAFKLDLFGLVTYYVGINMRDEKNQNLKKLMAGELPNLYLGVQYNAVLLLSPGKKKIIHSLNINQIESIKVEPIYLYLTVENVEKSLDFSVYVLKLKTVESFKISQLIKFYMDINLLYPQINQLKKDEIH